MGIGTCHLAPPPEQNRGGRERGREPQINVDAARDERDIMPILSAPARKGSTGNGQHSVVHCVVLFPCCPWCVCESRDISNDLQRGRRGLAVGNSHRGGLGLHLLVLERRSDVGDGAADV